jgi:hypothetical protein
VRETARDELTAPTEVWAQAVWRGTRRTDTGHVSTIPEDGRRQGYQPRGTHRRGTRWLLHNRCLTQGSR